MLRRAAGQCDYTQDPPLYTNQRVCVFDADALLVSDLANLMPTPDRIVPAGLNPPETQARKEEKGDELSY